MLTSLLETLAGEEMAANAGVQWGVGLAVLVAVSLLLATSKKFLARHLEGLSEHREASALEYLGHLVRSTGWSLYLAVGGYAGLSIVDLTPDQESFLFKLLAILLFVQIGQWGGTGVQIGVDRYRERLGDDPAQTSAIALIRFFGRVAVWVAVGLLVIDNLGFDITALVASLGIGGVAIALAVQNILGDLFASLSIVVDKPFVHGDFIIVGEFMGTVEQIGLKTTRVRSLGGEEIIFSNQDLLQSRVRNLQRMQERRVVFEVGVEYQTSTEHVEAIPGMIRETIEEMEQARFDRSHFKQFGQSSLDFEVVYYVLGPGYPLYMDVQQSINLEILKTFREKGIEVAYPTRTIHVAGGEPEGAGEQPERAVVGGGAADDEAA